MQPTSKRQRLTNRNELIHARFKVLSEKKTKKGKPVYTFEYLLELLEAEFPPLSAGYIQQILSYEPHEFPITKQRKTNARRRK